MPIYCMWDRSLHPKIFQVVKMASISVITLNLTIIKFYVVKEVSKCIYRHTCKCAHKHTHIYGILKASYLLGVVFTILLVSRYNCCGRHYTTKVTMLVWQGSLSQMDSLGVLQTLGSAGGKRGGGASQTASLLSSCVPISVAYTHCSCWVSHFFSCQKLPEFWHFCEISPWTMKHASFLTLSLC